MFFPNLKNFILSLKWNLIIRLFFRRKIDIDGWVVFTGEVKFKLNSSARPSLYIGKGSTFLGNVDLRTRDTATLHLGANLRLDGPIRIVAAGKDKTVTIEDFCRLTPYTIINGGGSIKIGRGTLIGPSFILNANTHIFDKKSTVIMSGFAHYDIEIGEDVWIGGQVSILPGAHVSSHCIIGAQSLVNSELPPWSISVGTPARVIDWRDKTKKLEL